MPLLDSLLEKRSELIAAARRHGATNVRLFGSVVRGEETPSSDLDILVDLAGDGGFADFLALAEELEALTGIRVESVSAVKSDRIYLRHIGDSINAIEKYTSGGRDAFWSG